MKPHSPCAISFVTCANLVRLSGQHIQRIQKALQLMNLKLTKVLGDVTGVTGLKIIRAILAGERDPVKLAQLRRSAPQARHGSHRHRVGGTLSSRASV
jgi:hypothetical protein